MRAFLSRLLLLGAGIGLTACDNSVDAQRPVTPPDIPSVSVEPPSETKTDLSPFVPAGFKIFTVHKGDLNKDGFEDIALILAQENEFEAREAYSVEGSPKPLRPLLLLARDQAGSLTLFARNDKAIRCHYCGGPRGEPFEDIQIQDGILKIFHSGGTSWMWTLSAEYRFDPKTNDMVLHEVTKGFGRYDTNADWKSDVKTSDDFGVVTFADHNIYGEL